MKPQHSNAPHLGLVSYTDRKRYLWLLALLVPLTPLLGIALSHWLSAQWILWLPLIGIYLGVPLLDRALPNDTENPPESAVPQLEADPYFRRLIYAAVVLHLVGLVSAACFIANTAPSVFGMLGLALLTGAMSGLSLNLGHELGHKPTNTDQLMAKLALAIPCYGHFTIEHNAGHHRHVATPEDSASARFGESIYRFALREIPGGFRRAWHIERRRLKRRGISPWSWHNRIVRAYGISAALYGGLLAALGSTILPFLVVQTAFAWWQLTSANYVEHYGLLRQKKANGRYERCQPHHSWNANHRASNLVMFHLERHSDHHAFPSRHYQSLRHYENVPQLPSGYFGMFLLAYVPTLWFAVMNPRVLALAGGDRLKLNLGVEQATVNG